MECHCESTACGHGTSPCTRTATKPAPVRYLEGEPMCDECIEQYLAAGYGTGRTPIGQRAEYVAATIAKGQ